MNNINNRILEAIDFESNNRNFKFDFKNMTKKYGKDFIDLLKVMWSVNDNVLDENEFCKLNGIDINFFNKVVKN